MRKTVALLMTAAIATMIVVCGCEKRHPRSGGNRPPAAKTGPSPKKPAPARPAPQPPPPPPAPEPAERPGIVTEVQNAVDGMAGGAAFRAGQKAKAKVQGINAKHNKQLDAALGD